MNVALIGEIALLLDSAGFTIGTAAHRSARDMTLQEADATAVVLAQSGIVMAEDVIAAMAARNVGANRTAWGRMVADGVPRSEARELLQALEEAAEDALVQLKPSGG